MGNKSITVDTPLRSPSIPLTLLNRTALCVSLYVVPEMSICENPPCALFLIMWQWTLLGQFEQWTLLGQFERSAFLFIKLGGHGPEGHHVPRRVDYVQMSPDVISERLQAFENKHLFPLLNRRLRDSAEDVDTFLSFLQREVNLDIGDCLERFRSAFRRTRPISAECTGGTISVKCAPRAAEHCKSHWCLIFEQQFTEISGSPTKTGIEWYEDGDRDPTHDITYPVKTDPGLKELKKCALQLQPRGNTTEHWSCPCALWVSTVIHECTQKGYVQGTSSCGISAQHLVFKLVYRPLGI
ncbi:hypothetical protein G4B11_000203 [Aspergillus flavus]|nr:hypothetical protein G4B11_000203 [Aspergillus flavus]